MSKHPFANHPLLSATPVEPEPGVDIPLQMARQAMLREIRQLENRRRIPFKDVEAWDLGKLTRYRNYIGFWDGSVNIPGICWDDDDGASLGTF